MNSIAFFAMLTGEKSTALRKDALERVHARYKNNPGHEPIYEMRITAGERDKQQIIKLNKDAVLTVDIPKPANVMLYCMSALADDETERVPGEENGEIRLNERFLKFGDHLLLIHDATQFAHRISAAIANEPNAYNSKFFEGGYGLVDYLDLSSYSGSIGLFRKDQSYAWQNEFRICFGVKNESLNQDGAYELQIGDISDISQILPVQAFIDEPIKLTRRMVRKVGDEYVEI